MATYTFCIYVFCFFVFFFLMAIFGTAVVNCINLFISKCFECFQSGEKMFLKNSLTNSRNRKNKTKKRMCFKRKASFSLF